MTKLKCRDVLEVQDKLRAALPEMVDRETVIRLYLQAVDEALEVIEGVEAKIAGISAMITKNSEMLATLRRDPSA